jgi:hypothetical protein
LTEVNERSKIEWVNVMKMKELRADDVSILAMIAESPKLSSPEFVDLLGKLSRDAQLIAHAIVALETRGRRPRTQLRHGPIQQAAKALVEWAKTNKSGRNEQFAVALRTE